MKTEDVAGDAPRLYQAILPHLHPALWNDVRNARTLAWMVSGLVLSQSVSVPSWLPRIHSQAHSPRAPNVGAAGGWRIQLLTLGACTAL